MEAGSRWAEIAPRIVPREAPIEVLDELPQFGEFVALSGCRRYKNSKSVSRTKRFEFPLRVEESSGGPSRDDVTQGRKVL